MKFEENNWKAEFVSKYEFFNAYAPIYEREENRAFKGYVFDQIRQSFPDAKDPREQDYEIFIKVFDNIERYKSVSSLVFINILLNNLDDEDGHIILLMYQGTGVYFALVNNYTLRNPDDILQNFCSGRFYYNKN